jgi:hypothetical protein
MDLRKYSMSSADRELARSVLNYQPFIISDDVQTGVAYSWLYDTDGGRHVYSREAFVFDRNSDSPEIWTKAVDANRRLAAMYDAMLDGIAARFPGHSLADMACNNGYFPIGASLRGMKACAGFDQSDYGDAINFLNRITGSEASFLNRSYNPWLHRVDDFEPHDVVICSQIMQHIPDPLYFLSFLASRAKKALLIFQGMGETDELQVYYKPPNRFYKDTKFPVNFDNDVGLSRGMLMLGLDQLGFDEVIEMPWRPEWLPASWYGSQKVLLAIRKTRPYFHNHHGVF